MRSVSRLAAAAALAVGVVLSGGLHPPLARSDDKPVVVKVADLSAPAPAGWKSEKPKYTLRSYQFRLPGADEGHAGELIVMPESSPKIDREFPRWKAQFTPPEGKTADDISKVTKLEGVKGATITLLDVNGTWNYKERPFDPKSPTLKLENWRVVWAVVDTKDETAHVRLSGPKETVDKYYPGFEKWLRSLK